VEGKRFKLFSRTLQLDLMFLLVSLLWESVWNFMLKRMKD
jgi:hypothetical protein